MFSFSENLFLPVFLSGMIFFIGLFGVLVRRNVLVILMSLELMLNGVNLNILSFARIYGWEEGPVLVFFIMTLAAAAAGVGLALAVRVYRVFKAVEVTSFNTLRE